MPKLTKNPIAVTAAILAAVLAAAMIACSGNQVTATATPAPAISQVETSAPTNSVASAGESGSSADAQKVVSTSPVFAPASQSVRAADQGSGQAGIWVNGIGSTDVDADVAIISLGVESREVTVAAARAAAAAAMSDVLDALRALGVGEDDIVTTSLNIHPNQVWIEVKDDAGTHNEPRITGYVVNNQVRVTVRDIEMADEVIDTAAEVGGDLIRINNISFAVGDPDVYSAEIRRRAVADAQAKAEIYADASGVKLGPLVFLQEVSGAGTVSQNSFGLERAMFMSDATPIESGSIGLSATIRAGFTILP